MKWVRMAQRLRGAARSTAIASGEEYEKACAELQDEDCNLHNLKVSDSLGEGPARLLTTTARKEGDEVMVARHQLFSSMPRLCAFLNTGGNAALLESPILKVTYPSSDPDTPQKAVYVVILGAARYLQDAGADEC